jgi:hypothetical protein
LFFNPSHPPGLDASVQLLERIQNPLPTPPLPTPTPTQAPTASDESTLELRRVVISERARKMMQLIGDFDAELGKPTVNQTAARYHVIAADLGVPFRHKNYTYVLFGDTIGPAGGDAIAYTADVSTTNGIHLDFISNANGMYQPVTIPGIDQGDFNVPMAGVSVGGKMYVYHTTDSFYLGSWAEMGRSIVAVSEDDGHTFKYLYDFSRQNFINVSITLVNRIDWAGLPLSAGEALVIFGSGRYRHSDVYLATQPSTDIAVPTSLRYWAGFDPRGQPVWSPVESDARRLFDQPCVGEFSVTYNRFIRKWIMLYNCEPAPWRGINLRTADYPWGPWSEPQIIFQPWEDKGYCFFIHVSWAFRNCDQVHAPGKQDTWGGEYAPYQFADFATGDSTHTTIYFTMSTWNPYTVVLMQAALQLAPE